MTGYAARIAMTKTCSAVWAQLGILKRLESFSLNPSGTRFRTGDAILWYAVEAPNIFEAHAIASRIARDLGALVPGTMAAIADFDVEAI